MQLLVHSRSQATNYSDEFVKLNCHKSQLRSLFSVSSAHFKVYKGVDDIDRLTVVYLFECCNGPFKGHMLCIKNDKLSHKVRFCIFRMFSIEIPLSSPLSSCTFLLYVLRIVRCMLEQPICQTGM